MMEEGRGEREEGAGERDGAKILRGIHPAIGGAQNDSL
jgi:hypothetical protein